DQSALQVVQVKERARETLAAGQQALGEHTSLEVCHALKVVADVEQSHAAADLALDLVEAQQQARARQFAVGPLDVGMAQVEQRPDHAPVPSRVERGHGRGIALRWSVEPGEAGHVSK